MGQRCPGLLRCRLLARQVFVLPEQEQKGGERCRLGSRRLLECQCIRRRRSHARVERHALECRQMNYSLSCLVLARLFAKRHNNLPAKSRRVLTLDIWRLSNLLPSLPLRPRQSLQR